MGEIQNTPQTRVAAAEESPPALHSVNGGRALVNSAGQARDGLASLAEIRDAGTVTAGNPVKPTHLRTLEAESIHILREVASECQRPVMLYSIGKDSSVLLRLCQKAFYPGRIPFPLLHIDTSYKFREMIEFRDRYTRALGVELLVYRNEAAIQEGTQPFKLGTQRCCSLLKTQALLDGIRKWNFDAAIGGARRDEEKSRAKERIFSFRDEPVQSVHAP